MNTGQDITFEDSTGTVPIEASHQTTGSTVTSSSSHGAGFYFQCGVLVVGIVGAAANGAVLYAMVASKQHKKHVLIFNQNVLDFVGCLFLVLAISMSLSNIDLSGTRGYWLCKILLSYAIPSVAYLSSMINLSAISIERYLKIVHHVWAKSKLRSWMIYSAIALAWIISTGVATALTIPSTAIVNGICYTWALSQTARKVYMLWEFLSFYAINLLIFIFCYGRILMVIRRQAHVMAAHSGQGSNTAQDQSNKIQTSVIKTMVLVCVLYSVTLAPFYIYNIFHTFDIFTANEIIHYIVLSIAYVYTCANPFIYATKFEPIKHVLLGLIPWKKSTQASGRGN